MPSLALLRRSAQETPRTHLDVARTVSQIYRKTRPAGRIGPLKVFARSDDSDNGSDMVINALLVVLGIAFLILILVSILLVLRRVRLQRQRLNQEEPALPSYDDVKSSHPNHRGLTIETTHNGRSSVLFISRDGQPMLRTPGSPPHSPDNVPEIHITFPDEHDDQGRIKSGRVVVVRVGENATVGLEPMHDEELPAYEKEAKGQFYSVDMDQIGGLKEKDRSYFDHY